MANFWKNLPKPFLVMAPMEDVTDYVFREIIAEIARPDVFFTEFTSTDGLFSKRHDKVVRNFKYSQKQRPIVAQIWGTKPENFYKAAQLVNELKFDGIDINMGCPDRTVVKHGSGAALIKNHDLTKEIIEATKSGAGDLPVSIKTRTGFSEATTEEWIGFLLQQKLDALVIHGRTAHELSKIPANWAEIGKAVNLRNKFAPNTVIVGNGDVIDYKNALENHKEYKVDGVMIGRGIFSNPWVFEKTLNPKKYSPKEHLELLLKHTKLFCDTWGTTKNFETMKKFFKAYVKDFRGADELRQKLMACKSYEQVESTISK